MQARHKKLKDMVSKQQKLEKEKQKKVRETLERHKIMCEKNS